MYLNKIAISHAFAAFALASTHNNPLYVDNAPDYVRPYVIEHYAQAQAVAVGQQIYRFPVTGPSSGGAFSLLRTSAPASGSLGVLPHTHQRHHENFYCLKGRYQLWTFKEDSNNNETQARLLTAGDYGSVPRNTTHTFQTLDPDTELVGVIVPGGFEKLFFFLADSNYTAYTASPYVPAPAQNSAGGGGSADLLNTLEGFDVYSQLQFNPRRDLVNGTAPANSGWHVSDDEIPAAEGSPYYLAKDMGPKYINGMHGWQIIQPFVTNVTGEEAFTQGSVTISRQQLNVTIPQWTLENHTAFEVLEGSLSLTIGRDSAQLITGDVAFIPGNTTFSYWSETAFTKFMYISAGTNGLDQQLIRGSQMWDFPVFPTYFA